jgi:hypothetical protein
MDADTISHGIQLAIAPVFLLTAVSGMIGAVANRLARIIDRARLLEGRIDKAGDATDTDALPNAAKLSQAYTELRELRNRGLLANSCIALLTLCGLMIGLTIIVLFLGETTNFQGLRLSMVSFLAGIVSFLLALICFLAETLIATRLLNFKRPQRRVE